MSEKMDIIDSQMAFRYFLYSDIALRNIIKALSVGGVARIHYDEGSPINLGPNVRVSLSEQELADRQKKLWQDIKKLINEGYLESTGSGNRFNSIIEGKDKQKYLAEGFIRLVKKKSLKSLNF